MAIMQELEHLVRLFEKKNKDQNLVAVVKKV